MAVPALLSVALAAFPARALGDYVTAATSNAPGSACSCDAAASLSTSYTPGCASFGSGSTLVTCINASFYTRASFSTPLCAGAPDYTFTASTGGCSCYAASSGAFPYVAATRAQCVASPGSVPSLADIAASAIFASFGAPCPSGDPAVLPPLASATQLFAGSSGCALAGASGKGALAAPSYVRHTCGPWGSASAYFSDAACTVPAPPYVFVGAPANTCSNNSYGPHATSSSAVLCSAPSPAAPSSPFGATGMPTCRGAANPAPLPLPTLDCYTGAASSAGPSSREEGVSPPAAPHLSVACFAATFSCAQQSTPTPMCESPSATVRVYGGAASAASLLSLAQLQGASGGALPVDFFMCTSGSLCNAPAADACALAGAP